MPDPFKKIKIGTHPKKKGNLANITNQTTNQTQKQKMTRDNHMPKQNSCWKLVAKHDELQSLMPFLRVSSKKKDSQKSLHQVKH